ncbi:MAG: protoporphyrinogen oxidase HemJ [Alphaproteobacteria bacterium]
MDWLALYPWIKALHIVSVMAWMAGMLYLPRLFVYHCDAPAGSQQSETFKVMERRLMRGIINPAMIATWLFGLILLFQFEIYRFPWMHAKLVLVVAMSGIHGFLSQCRRAFAEDRNTRSARFYRILNEVPALLMVLIVLLAVAKPF